MSANHEPDFGATHGPDHLVIDDEGTEHIAFYADGTWWEARPDKCRVQLARTPVALFAPGASA